MELKKPLGREISCNVKFDYSYKTAFCLHLLYVIPYIYACLTLSFKWYITQRMHEGWFVYFSLYFLWRYAAVCDEQCSLHGGVCDNGVCEFRCSDYAGYTCQNSSMLLPSLSVCKDVLQNDVSGQHCAPSELSILQQLEEVVVMPNYNRLFPAGPRKILNIFRGRDCDGAAKRLACWVSFFIRYVLNIWGSKNSPPFLVIELKQAYYAFVCIVYSLFLLNWLKTDLNPKMWQWWWQPATSVSFSLPII